MLCTHDTDTDNRMHNIWWISNQMLASKAHNIASFVGGRSTTNFLFRKCIRVRTNDGKWDTHVDWKFSRSRTHLHTQTRMHAAQNVKSAVCNCLALLLQHTQTNHAYEWRRLRFSVFVNGRFDGSTCTHLPLRWVIRITKTLLLICIHE